MVIKDYSLLYFLVFKKELEAEALKRYKVTRKKESNKKNVTWTKWDEWKILAKIWKETINIYKNVVLK